MLEKETIQLHELSRNFATHVCTYGRNNNISDPLTCVHSTVVHACVSMAGARVSALVLISACILNVKRL